jgi:hypothetical protein
VADALFKVFHDGGNTLVTIDQSDYSLTGDWRCLGTFDFTPGTNQRVQLRDEFTTGSVLVADAVAFVADDVPMSPATWTPSLPAADNYDIYVYWKSGASRTTEARYRVYHDGGETEVVKDQTTGGGQWNLLGTYSMTPGQSHRIEATNLQAGNPLFADALRIEPGGTVIWTDGFENEYTIPALGNLATWIPQISRLWGGDTSGIISYIDPDVVRFWNDQERDDTIANHHTMFEPNVDPVYTGDANGRTRLVGPRYLVKFKVWFEQADPDPKWNIFWQEKSHASVNPALAFTLTNGQLSLVRRGDDHDSIFDSESEARYEEQEVYDLGSAVYDQWIEFEYEIVNSYATSGSNPGSLWVSMNGTEIINETGIMTTYKDMSHGGNFTSFGMYQYMESSGNDENATRLKDIEIWILN